MSSKDSTSFREQMKRVMQQQQQQPLLPPAPLWSMQILGSWGESPPCLLPTRKSATPIVAQRSWELTDGYKLRSTYTATVWEGPILRADVKPKPHVRVGDPGDAGHGIYAWHIGVPTIVHAPATTRAETKTCGAVTGTVELKGTVIRHKNGYRAEVVRIRNLCLVELASRHDRNEVVHALENTYQCDVTWHFTLREIYNSLIEEGELLMP